MQLSSQMWSGSQANCTATLYYFSGKKMPTLASLIFTAGA